MLSTIRFATAIALAACATMPAMAGPGAHGPGGEHLDAPGAVSGSGGLARLPDGSVQVPKLAQRRMGIRTTMPQQAEHPLTVELNAVVAIDPNAGGRLQAGHPGWIEPPPGGFPVLGQRVSKGQVLAVLRHKNEPFDIGNQQAQFANLSASLKLARQRLQRLESLQDSIPRKEIEAARAEVQSLSGQREAVGKSLHQTDTLASPASGVIATANVMAGQVVAAGDVLYEVVDPARLLIAANTADSSLANRIRGGTLGRADGAKDGGKLDFIGAGRSLKNGAMPLMFRLTGNAVPLAVGQPVTVVATLTDTVKGIALPSEALVRNASNLPVVWIKSGTQRFIAQPVEARVLDARTVVVVKGLSPENRVVVSGAALINQIR
ncbi:RND transporter [Cupriavidus sp. TA19]|uniref:efflux RND transporter periplasmic adaptor subunit n=1 Tax=unclassified Cupriavidus TaxID=2640874 RepID=UPI000E2F1F58|nr:MULTISPECIES: HlyD family efflux transporter periplasmic adaptor subunit [unclassified Cupriavidus]BDB28820.1 efflux RND transporter periplasmic adaptor subunit [Cupriavidus sp. P-10]GLC96463.1 RND transporter [Cupriavidus sp. TA19]